MLLDYSDFLNIGLSTRLSDVSFNRQTRLSVLLQSLKPPLSLAAYFISNYCCRLRALSAPTHVRSIIHPVINSETHLLSIAIQRCHLLSTGKYHTVISEFPLV